ncbi:hypothetical protein [Actinomycetospora flava]|uniref:Tc toxin complex TcA C-terminal TcB-binding domain-containing protein n=1 Tax=Actinomycetospora flava TaxID=3129232 RepID=A0ABU8M7B9_9PSEU
MADAVDLFKFMTVRSLGAEGDGAIRDERLAHPVPAGEPVALDKDDASFAKSPAATAVYGLVKSTGAGKTTPQAVVDANEEIATKVVAAGPITEDTPGERVDALAGAVALLGSGTTAEEATAAFTAAWPESAGGSWTGYAARAESEATATAPSLAKDLGELFDRLYRATVAVRRRPVDATRLIAAIRSLTVVRRVYAGDLPVLGEALAAQPAIHPMITALVGYYVPFNPIRPVGVGDLLVVKQFLRRYEPGAIAHIENVLPGEKKIRQVRQLDQVDDLLSTITEKSETTETEKSKSERFELKSETETTIQNDLSVEVSGQVSGRYGVVEYSAQAGAQYSRSQTDSRRGANNFAKDVVDRSLSRIQTSVREERTTRRLTQNEQLDRHELAGANDGVTGIYRWVDSVYDAQVYNYGKRLMYEFMIPEPAAFVLSVFDHEREQEERPDIPQPPPRPELDVNLIDSSTVATWTKIFPLGGLAPEPLPQTVPMTIIMEPQTAESTAEQEIFDIPEGYGAVEALIKGNWEGMDKSTNHGVSVSIGGQNELQSPGSNVGHMGWEERKFTFDPMLVGRTAVAVWSYRTESYSLGVGLKIVPTPSHLQNWRIRVYETIMAAYQQAQREYLAAQDEYDAALAAHKVRQGVVIQGRNPRINQDVIRTELRKSCLSMIAKQFDADGATTDDIVFDAMSTRAAKLPVEAIEKITTTTEDTSQPGKKITVTSVQEKVTTADADIKIPAIDVAEAVDEGSTIQFLEQAFEWQQLNYVLYPYFWGRLPRKWYDAQRYYDEVDPLYAKFLQSGAARVLVSVRPGFEGALLHYLRTREPWNGGPMPDIDDPLYLAVHEELREQQDDLNNAVPYGEPWTVVVPTPQLWLQPDGTLPEYPGAPDRPGDGGRAGALWTGTARQEGIAVLAHDQTAWTAWPPAARWTVPIPTWAAAADVRFVVNPGVAEGDVWGELRVDIDGIRTEPSMFDVNYESDIGEFPQQDVMIVADTVAIPADRRGRSVTVRTEAHTRDPSIAPGQVQAHAGSQIGLQLVFKPALEP